VTVAVVTAKVVLQEMTNLNTMEEEIYCFKIETDFKQELPSDGHRIMLFFINQGQ